MTPAVKDRIEQIRHGNVPDGYKKTESGIIPNEWRVGQIAECIEEYKVLSNDIVHIPVYSSSRKGLIPQSDYYDQREAVETNLGYKVVPLGYVTYRHMSDDDVFHFNINGTGGDILVSSEYPVFTTSSNCDLGFLIPALNSTARFRYFCKTQKLGGTRTRLYLDNLKKYTLPLPPHSEQQKIAEILTAQDKVIELKEKRFAEKQRQKKYLMQQLLTGKKRIPGFGGEWKSVKLNEVLFERTDKNVDQNHRICSVAVQKGVVDQVEHLGRSYAAADTSNYGVAYYGDIIYTKSPTGDFPYGIIKQSQLVENVAVSPLYGIYEPVCYELGYILHTYFSNAINCSNYLLPIVQKGAKNTINITNSVFVSNRLYLPTDSKEQKALAKIFITADKEIDLLRQDIEQEKQKKKALMQLLLTGVVRV